MRKAAGKPGPEVEAERRCELCGIRLSRYARDDERLCWTCSHREAMPAHEREWRLRSLLESDPIPVLPHPRFVCPRCHGLKTRNAKVCAHCRFRAFHPRKPPRGTLVAGPCPVCGGPKSPKARLCRSCWKVDQRLLFLGNPAKTCPDCGGPKVRHAKRCRRCSERRRFGTVYVGSRPRSLVCPECGGPKRLARAARCRRCWLRSRREAAAAA
jgi:hypothetical protein